MAFLQQRLQLGVGWGQGQQVCMKTEANQVAFRAQCESNCTCTARGSPRSVGGVLLLYCMYCFSWFNVLFVNWIWHSFMDVVLLLVPNFQIHKDNNIYHKKLFTYVKHWSFVNTLCFFGRNSPHLNRRVKFFWIFPRSESSFLCSVTRTVFPYLPLPTLLHSQPFGAFPVPAAHSPASQKSLHPLLTPA